MERQRFGETREEKGCSVFSFTGETSSVVTARNKGGIRGCEGVKVSWGCWITRGVAVDAEGAAGGLISLWNEDLFSVKACITSKRCNILVGELVSIKKEVVICNVYASNTEPERKELWEFILLKQSLFSIPWCIGGDFNTVLDPSERRGGVCEMGSVKNFQDFVRHVMVVDISLQGVPFTWTNSRELASWARLDHFLVSPIILSWLPQLIQMGLPKNISDHNAITLGNYVKDWGPCPFLFFNDWLEDRDLMKDWVKNKKDSSFSHKKVEEKLEKVDKRVVVDGWSKKLRNERVALVLEFWKGLRSEDLQRRQKSRVNWIKEGNRNTSFSIWSAIFQSFKVQFQNVGWQRPSINGLGSSRISTEESEFLEAKFSKEEVWEAVCNCDGNKDPGPDGINLNFVKVNWEVVGADFMNFIEEFHKDGSIVKEVNHSFINLIPKRLNPKTLGDFRPISLVIAMYKVLSKMLTNRLKRVLNSIIGDYQMAFVNDRQNMDSFVIAEEIIHDWKSSNEEGLLLKIDFEKAYDSVDHCFLDSLMEDFGFGEK
ncbi:hypothetical protein Ddye_011221 [Dipteronia dyeriana]|uniref:Reverse transcriptase domain-containing protein n=1 Tax=Dipteronia dyeriana TaxID=168575 RepID=A0AAD9UBX4_9ROSI|nr:hypothetical protein Ddye_011221 [Dipteronia dyeriana]